MGDRELKVLDEQTLKRLEEIQTLPPADQQALMLTIDIFISRGVPFGKGYQA